MSYLYFISSPMQWLKVKKLRYMSFNCKFFTIQLPNQQQVNITIQDIMSRQKYQVLANKTLLSPYDLDPLTFYQQLYNQSVFQKELDQWIQPVDGFISFRFTFHNCSLPLIKLSCKLIDLNQEKNMREGNYFEGVLKEKAEQLMDKMVKKMQQYGKKRLGEFEDEVSQRVERGLGDLQRGGKEILDTLASYEAISRQNNLQKYQQHLNDSLKRILQSNIQIVQEFDLIRVNLEKQVVHLSESIQAQKKTIEQLQKEIEQNRQQFQDGQIALMATFKEGLASCQEKIRIVQSGLTHKTEKIPLPSSHQPLPISSPLLSQLQLFQPKELSDILTNAQPALFSSLNNKKTKKRSHKEAIIDHSQLSFEPQ